MDQVPLAARKASRMRTKRWQASSNSTTIVAGKYGAARGRGAVRPVQAGKRMKRERKGGERGGLRVEGDGAAEMDRR